MKESINMREVRKQRKGKYKRSTITIRVEVDREVFFKLESLKARMKATTWREFFDKILEKEDILASDMISY